MYAVLTDNTVLYLGECRTQAVEVLDQNPEASIVTVDSLEDLARHVQTFDESEDILSEAAVRIFEKLEELGFTAENAEDLAHRLRTNGEKAVAEVRSLGIRGMRAVGEGFIALGDLLRRAEEKQAEDDDSFLDQLRKL